MTRTVGLVRGFVALCALALGVSGAAPAAAAKAAPVQPHLARAVLAGGCFWGMEGVFEHVDGVTNVVAGYSGGSAATAHYDMTSSGTTGHAESVEITYDPARVSYETLLEVFFTVAHDPTTLNRQGPDAGTQYRSAVFYADETQKRAAQAEIAALTGAHAFPAPIVTQVVPLRAFYPAEAHHQHYMARNPYDPYILINDRPKLTALRAKFPALAKKG
ncbi:MAG: peptide-methionine (S)-S-oxide reductase [Candidatus Eremiobacteraeota bacterium]|nr:peptide-methionine (S)-S-oxide reductase [Candidatus Eremiobacteraeota bacterium]